MTLPLRPAGLRDSDSDSDYSLTDLVDDQPSRYVRRSGWVDRVLFPTASLYEFAVFASFLVYFMDTFPEHQGAIVTSNLLQDFHDAGIYPPAQGDHSPGKPGKVREFQSGQGKVRGK